MMRNRFLFLLPAVLSTSFSGCIFFSSGPAPFGCFASPSQMFGWNASRRVVPPKSAVVEEWTPQTEPQEIQSSEGPAVLPQGTPLERGLSVAVEAPREERAGNPAEFQLTLQNNDPTPLPDVVVEVDFDEQLLFPGSDEKKVRRALGTIPAGETKTISLLLTGTGAGRLCSRFTIFSRGREKHWKSVCVEFLP